MSAHARSTLAAPEPHNLEAEESLLGAMAVNPKAIPIAIEVVAADDFYRDTHRVVFRVIRDMHALGEEVDAVTLSAELERQGVLLDGGVKAFVHTLVEVVPAAANVRQYAEIVARLAGERRAREALHEALEVIGSGDRTLVRAAVEKLAAVCDESAAKLVLPVVRACDLATTMPEDALFADYVFFGAITLLVAKVKAGKTTLLLMLIAAVLHGRPFLDRRTSKATVLLYSEEGKQSLLAALRRAGLEDEPDLHIFFKQDTRGRSFDEVMTAIINHGRKVAGDGQVFLIVDTIASAGRPVDDKKLDELGAGGHRGGAARDRTRLGGPAHPAHAQERRRHRRFSPRQQRPGRRRRRRRHPDEGQHGRTPRPARTRGRGPLRRHPAQARHRTRGRHLPRAWR